ncbi:ABC transporter ATP-binding protein [Dactylosporangium sp. NPDC048998]|uniref:ABC transporter ATP-binding protein n=1 Tax=Dactylosporangium sp. NPDC048998 TaxID=3363976 RepID=UPI00372480C8
MPADRPAVRLRGVHKRYGDVVAVGGVDLEVVAGGFLGLLGPNGAGKSTTMRLLTGQSRADQGEVEVLGQPMPAQGRRVRSLTGVVHQHDSLDEDLTARENLDVFVRLTTVPRPAQRGAVARALDVVRLTQRADTRVRELSGGMRRRLLLARGIVAAPRLLLLDEPTVGLDPQARQDLWEILDGLRAGGTTVVMSTHYIEEAERLADEVAVLFAGQVIARGAPTALLQQHVGAQAAEYQGDRSRRAAVEAAASVAGQPYRRTGLSVSLLRAERMPEGLRREIGPPDVLRRTTLEDVFVELTGELFG